MTQHRINTGDHPPIKQYPRRLPLAKKEEAERLVKEMVDNGIIEESETEGQISRWIQRLKEYYFEIQHRKATSHGNTDALTRRPCKESCKHRTYVEKKFGMETDISMKVLTTEDAWSSTEFQKAQLEDPAIKPILGKKLNSDDRPTWQEIAPESLSTKRY
ncbi:hypothetical protein AVEN_233693-1 [Araneus ventricosus]|uniref:Uncharacterized protein n=1 Tax=Araneus ventricosus TaxID=182803 RepID=A0A4Y2K5H1_ARAVE|nr:hypothetical protein AVEN_233693-1 [Araneus ventricosus]